MFLTETAKNWPQIFDKKAIVSSLNKREAGSFEEFKKRNLETWPKIYSNYSEKKIKEKYQDFVDHVKSFHGCCKLNDEIQFISRKKAQVVIMSPNWTGKIIDHQDLELWLRKEYHIWPSKSKLKCKIYSFGTLHVPAGSVEAQMGEKVGNHRVSHLVGDYEVKFNNFKNPKTITLSKNDSFGKESISFKIIA